MHNDSKKYIKNRVRRFWIYNIAMTNVKTHQKPSQYEEQMEEKKRTGNNHRHDSCGYPHQISTVMKWVHVGYVGLKEPAIKLWILLKKPLPQDHVLNFFLFIYFSISVFLTVNKLIVVFSYYLFQDINFNFLMIYKFRVSKRLFKDKCHVSCLVKLTKWYIFLFEINLK